MNRDQFWLTEDQFSRLAPSLPTDTRGKPRVDDKRVISGIVHVLKSGTAFEETGSFTAFGRLWPIAFVLVVLAAEVGWVALLGYGLVFLFS